MNKRASASCTLGSRLDANADNAGRFEVTIRLLDTKVRSGNVGKALRKNS